MDTQKAVLQHLRSLARAGVETLPKGTGELEIAWPAEEALDSADADIQPNHVAEAKPEHSTKSYDSPVASPEPATAKESGSNPTASPTKQSNLPSDRYGASLRLSDRKNALEVIQSEVQGCTKCPELVESRTQTVFGVGTPTPRLVFVGEGPGADEDRIGEPFVGAAGQLLNKIIEACKLSREDIYILNTVKCRPPGNRNPSVDELSNCWNYAQRQLEVLQPEFICCLGSVAAKRILNTTDPLGRLRQRFHQYRGSRVIVTYHPAYLLRTPSAKKHVWGDMKLLMKEMGVDLSN